MLKCWENDPELRPCVKEAVEILQCCRQENEANTNSSSEFEETVVFDG
jgi:hypothetical protein